MLPILPSSEGGSKQFVGNTQLVAVSSHSAVHITILYQNYNTVLHNMLRTSIFSFIAKKYLVARP